MNQKEYESLYNKYVKNLNAFAMSFLKENSIAEEVVQQVYYKIWENRESINLEKPIAYLLTATKHEALKEIKRRKRYLVKNSDLTQATSYEDEQDGIAPNLGFKAVKEAIEILPSKCKQIMKLKIEDGLTHSEIANFLNISEKTIENQVSIAFKKIRQLTKKSFPILGGSLLIFILYML